MGRCSAWQQGYIATRSPWAGISCSVYIGTAAKNLQTTDVSYNFPTFHQLPHRQSPPQSAETQICMGDGVTA